MKLQTLMPLSGADNQIGYGSQIFLVGSCFAAHMGAKLWYFKFQTAQNPHGILFHPLAIKKMVARALEDVQYTEADIFFHNERWHCLDAHSSISDVSPEKVLHALNRGLAQTREWVGKASHMVITLGTAWVYRSAETGKIVANCHKLPQESFYKELLSIDDISESLGFLIRGIGRINPSAQLIFTVSPVRHLRDGFIENQRSKSHLLAALHHTLGEKGDMERARYFPAYEMMMDELRDYRFYERDLVHPNALAVDYIWQRFKEVWVLGEANGTMVEVDKIQKGLQHQPFNARSKAHRIFLEDLSHKIHILKGRFPFMEFDMP
ncbi:MAG: GSCFA domain-containing protein [Flavobacteriaceae bacterium]